LERKYPDLAGPRKQRFISWNSALWATNSALFFLESRVYPANLQLRRTRADRG